MRLQHLFLSLPLLLLIGCTPEPAVKSSEPQTVGQASSSVRGSAVVADYRLEAPLHFGNVSIVPISFAKTPQNRELDEYLTLTQAKNLGVIEIEEVSDGGQVDTLRVTNKGEKPIMLLGGELLLGGKQDRIVATDTIIPAHETVKVSVYCVEQGRWSGTSKHFESGELAVPTSVRDAAAHEDQQKVWDNVARFNESAGVGSSAGSTVNSGLKSRTVDTEIQKKLPEIEAALKDRPNLVGVMFVLNGEIRTVDIFGAPRLFDSSRTPLLRGYIAEAATAKVIERTPVSLAECTAFMKRALEGERKQLKRATQYGAGTFESGDINGTMITGGVAGDIAVHQNYSPKK